ncbi:MAG: type II secretion system protein GspG [Thermoanaerobaculia bacterium]
MRFAVVLVLLVVVPTSAAAASEEDAVKAFETLYAVYDTAAILESLRADGVIPRIDGPAALSRATFGHDGLVEYLVDPWGTPLHIESVPGEGYVIAAAGADRAFDRATWQQAAKTTSTAEDVVLRSGKIVRSPEEWALSLVKLTPEQLRAEQSSSKRKGTIADLRSIVTSIIAYEIDAGKLPAARDIDALARLLEPTYVIEMPRTDGWGRELDLAIASTLDEYSLASAGPDGRRDTDDDIVVKNHEFVKNAEIPAADRLVDAWAGYQAARSRLESAR